MKTNFEATEEQLKSLGEGMPGRKHVALGDVLKATKDGIKVSSLTKEEQNLPEWDEIPEEEKPTKEEIEEIVKEGDRIWKRAQQNLDTKVTEAINPHYENIEEAINDIFDDCLADKLREIRKEYKIPKESN